MSQIDNLPPLRDVIAKYDLAAKKSLGQNFLLDLNLTMKIARVAGDLADSTIIEVGPGPGGLTRALLASGAAKVIAIERDQRFLPALEEIAKVYPDRLVVMNEDALEIDYGQLLKSEQSQKDVRIVANLPYNVATPLLIQWLSIDHQATPIHSMTLMFQKEVAQRICANHTDKAYGRLAVLANWKCDTEIVFDVPRGAFVPPPKITSSIVGLVPKQSIIPCNLEKLQLITKAAFGQRRKMLRASLKSLGGETLLNAAGIDGTLRAEALDIDDFIGLANQLD